MNCPAVGGGEARQALQDTQQRQSRQVCQTSSSYALSASELAAASDTRPATAWRTTPAAAHVGS
jgi:hypothetical protein